jgi:redox-sensitive bicupin YhaK (pirin superfamily)
VTLASGYENDGDALRIRAEGRMVAATLKAGQTAEYELGSNRRAYLVPAVGKIEVNGIELLARDGAAIADEAVVKVTALEDSEVILVDVA